MLLNEDIYLGNKTTCRGRLETKRKGFDGVPALTQRKLKRTSRSLHIRELLGVAGPPIASHLLMDTSRLTMVICIWVHPTDVRQMECPTIRLIDS